MISAVIQIGNSDNKLTQSEWAHFATVMHSIIVDNSHFIHFRGGSDWDAPWQNACWVCEVKGDQINSLKDKITICRISYKQDSVAIILGKTEFV